MLFYAIFTPFVLNNFFISISKVIIIIIIIIIFCLFVFKAFLSNRL